MSNDFYQIPLSELRVKLPKLRRKVQLGKQRLVATHYGEVVAFLVPLEDIKSLISNREDPVIHQTQEMSLTEFRAHLTEAWELLQSGIDCIYITFHSRPVIAFVSPHLSGHLPLPIIGNSLVFSDRFEEVSR